MSPLSRRRLLGGGIAAGAGFLLAACSGGAEKPAASDGRGAGTPTSPAGTPTGSASTAPAKKSLKVGLAAMPGSTSLDPLKNPDIYPYVALMNVASGLVAIQDGVIVKELATSITNDDAQTWTVKLNPEAKFSDGTPLTSADVLASLATAAKDPLMGALLVDLDVAASKAVDEHTVALKLKRERADLVEAILTGALGVVKGGDYTLPVGAGPYQIGEHDEKGFKLIPNPHYYQDAPVIEDVTVLAIGDAAAVEKAVQAGQIDLGFGVPGTAERTLTAPAHARKADLASASAMAFSMNCAMAPFDDPKLRMALRQLVDRDKLLQVVLGGQGTIGADLLGVSLPGYDTSRKPVKHDAEAAKAAFAAAGVTKLTAVTADYQPGMNDSIELLRQQLEAIGVELAVTKLDRAVFFQDMSHFATHNIYAMGYINRLVAVSLPMFYSQMSAMNFTKFTDSEFDTLLAQTTTERDAAARDKLLLKAQAALYERGPDVIWGYRPSMEAVYGEVPTFALGHSIPLFDKPR